VMELIKSLTGGPSKKNKMLVYNLAIMQPGQIEPRELRQVRSERLGMTGIKSSIPVIENFAARYLNIISNSETLKTRFFDKVTNTLNSINLSGMTAKAPAQVSELAAELRVNPQDLFAVLFKMMRDFREDLFEEGKGAYLPTSGEDLEADNLYLTTRAGYLKDIKYEVKIDMVDPDEVAGARRGEQYVESKPEFAVAVPQLGNYASVPSMIKSDSEMGVLGNFMNYILTGMIRNVDPGAAIAKMMGMSATEYRNLMSGGIDQDIEY